MNKNLLIFTFFICASTCNSIYGQRDSLKHSFSLNIPSLISFYYQNLDIGYQLEINNRISIEIGMGYLLPSSKYDEDEVGKFKNKGFSYRIEPKFGIFDYRSNSKMIYQLFVGTKYYYTKHDYLARRHVGIDTNSEIVNYNVNSTINSINFMIGIKIVAGRAYHEVSTGIGRRYLTILNDSPMPISNYSDTNRYFPSLNPEENGKHKIFTIPLNLKVGIRF